MKYILYSLILVLTFCLKHKLSAQDIEFQKKSLENDFYDAIYFPINEPIIADFNGDGIKDTAVYKKENKTTGIVIKHGGTTKEVKIGFEKNFAHLCNFNWVDFWGLVKDSTTYEIFFDKSETLCETIVRLENPSIVVRKEEVGGGLITYKDGIYKWIHQSD